VTATAADRPPVLALRGRLDRAIPTFGRRIPGIEGVRALAAGSIVLLHVWSTPGGSRPYELGPLGAVMPDLAFGVVVFFTLSAFLLYRPFAERVLERRPPGSVRRFARNRALRILPAYWVILLACGVGLGAALLRGRGGALDLGRLDDGGLLLRDLLLVQNSDPASVLTGIGPAWSLSVEVAFYALLPVLAWVAWSTARRRPSAAGARTAVLVPPAMLLVGGLATKAIAARVVGAPDEDAWQADWGGVLERSFFVHADLFAFGMALAVIDVEARRRGRSISHRGRSALVVAAAAIYASVAATTTYEQLTHSPSNTAIGLASALLLAVVVLPVSGPPSRMVPVLERRPLVLLGTISYSVFLWHAPLALWLRSRGWLVGGTWALPVNLAIVGGLTVVLSTITYRFVEAPFLRWKSGRG
jgi:peptidoglycan/LPS O-acetylase OafA/YrhL